MLILSRKDGQTVVMLTAEGERLEVVLCKSRKGRAVLGVKAGSGVKVLRGELEEEGFPKRKDQE